MNCNGPCQTNWKLNNLSLYLAIFFNTPTRRLYIYKYTIGQFDDWAIVIRGNNNSQRSVHIAPQSCSLQTSHGRQFLISNVLEQDSSSSKARQDCQSRDS